MPVKLYGLVLSFEEIAERKRQGLREREKKLREITGRLMKIFRLYLITIALDMIFLSSVEIGAFMVMALISVVIYIPIATVKL